MIKDTDEQSGEKIHKIKSGRSPVQELLSLWNWDVPPSSTWICSPTQKLLEPHTLGIFMEASSHGHDQSLTQSPALLLFSKGWKMRLKVPGF